MASPLYPDELVSKLLDEVAYNKGAIKVKQLWEIAKQFANVDDESIKEFVFSSLLSNPDINLLVDGKETNIVPYEKIKEIEDTASIALNEEKLWITLTGYGKKESAIGKLPFELLLEVAKAKEKGINTMNLVKQTKQDPRSITGRLKKLSQLVDTKQVIYQGHLVKQVTLKKFKQDAPTTKAYVNMRDNLETIVNVVKNSKNGVRQTTDLKRELKFDKEKRLSKAFTVAISWLHDKGYLQKVIIISPNNPLIRIRCVKYLKDYTNDGKVNTYEDEDDMSDDGPDAQGDANETRQDEEEELEGLDYFNATSLLQDQGLMMEDQVPSSNQKFMINRFYPIQNQTYDLVAATGTKGLSTIKVINAMVGRDYQRSFTKSSEYYVQTVGKKKLDSSVLNLVKIYDSEGKKKFYRIFTEENFKKMMDPSATFTPEHIKPSKIQKSSLAQLNKKEFTPLSNTLRFGTDAQNNEVFFWHGSDTLAIKTKDVKKLPKSVRKKRAAAREDAREGTPKAKKLKQISLDDMSSTSTVVDDTHLNVITEVKPKLIKEKRALNIDGFSADSLKALKRQRVLVQVLEKMGGVAYLKESFFDELSKALGSTFLVDKKTARGDTDQLVESGKLLLREDPKTKKRLIYLPGKTEHDLEMYLDKEKNKKKMSFSSTLHTSDIYFFDQSVKHRFTKSAKSAERINRFQNKNKPKTSSTGDKPERRTRRKMPTRSKTASDELKGRRNSLFTSIADGTSASAEQRKAAPVSKTTFHVGKQSGIEALIMAVVITKTITNEIQWGKISLIFPKNSVDNLKKKWTSRRVKMGHSGWKAYADKWKRILVHSIKDETVSLQDAESVNLPVLIELWINYEKNRKTGAISLYRDYKTNMEKHTFVRDPPQHTSQLGIMMSSMVQREASSLKETFLYRPADDSDTDDEKRKRVEDIKSVIRSILIDKVETGKEGIELLKDVPKDELDGVVLDMAKAKQVYLHGSKLEASPMIKETLESKGPFAKYNRAVEYNYSIEEVLGSGNGIVIDQEINDIAAWQLIDLISRRKIKMYVIPIGREIGNFHYTTRKFEIETLTPPLICAAEKSDQPLSSTSVAVPVPLGPGYSRLWINSDGHLRPEIWKNLISFVINEVLFNPGVMIERLQEVCYDFLSRKELSEICSWLEQKGLLQKLPFEGFMVTYKWYRLMA